MKFKVKLRLIDSSGKKHKYSLNLEEGSKFTLGRGTPGIGAELNHPTVSTAHCHLTISGGVLHVMDNKSRNGTKLNGKAVQNAAVRVGDMVQLGVCQIEFLEAPSPPVEENPQSTTFIDINELSPEEAKLLGKNKISDELRAPEPTMAMSKQALSEALSQPPQDEAPVTAATQSAPMGQNEEPSRVLDGNSLPAAQDAAAAYGGPTNPYAAPSNPYAAPTNPFAAPTNPYASPSVPDRPGSEPRHEDTLGFRPLDSYGRDREGEYRREDDPRYNPGARSRRRDEQEDSVERPSRSSKRSSREHTDTGATNTTKSRKASRSRGSQVDTHALVSTAITLFGTAAAGSLVSYQKGSYSPIVTVIAAVVGTMLVAFLAWILRKQNEFMEAEGEAKDYYRFLAYSTVALVPASMLTSSAIIFRLAAFIVLGVAFFHFFMVKFRPVAEKFVFLVGSYVCVVTFLGYMVNGQLSGGQVGPHPKNPRITKNQPQNPDDGDREPANDDSEEPQQPEQPPEQPPQTPPTQPPQPVQQPTQAVNSPPPQPVQTAQPQPVQQPQAANSPPPKIETPPDKPKNNKPGPDSFAISQLYKAAEHGDTDIVKKLITDKGVNPNTVAENGVTALMLAAYYGHTSTAKLLLNEKADINLKDRQGTTALMWAVLKGNREMVLLLVRAGANLTARRNDGDTALDIARLWHYDDVVRILEDPERAKKGLAFDSGKNNSRKPSSQPKSTKKAPPKTKGKPPKKKSKYSAKVDDDS